MRQAFENRRLMGLERGNLDKTRHRFHYCEVMRTVHHTIASTMINSDFNGGHSHER